MRPAILRAGISLATLDRLHLPPARAVHCKLSKEIVLNCMLANGNVVVQYRQVNIVTI